MDYAFGDVLLLPFPFTDGSTAKQRPAVVVSSAAYNKDRPDLIVMAITSQLKPTTAVGEVEIQEWAKAGLLKPSVVKPVIATLEKSLVRRQLGQLEEVDKQALHATFSLILG